MKSFISKLPVMLFVSASVFYAPLTFAGDTAKLTMDADINQAVFISPEAAAQEITNVISARDREKLGMILGLNATQLLPLDNIKKETTERYLKEYENSHSLQPIAEGQFQLVIGKDKWTLPIPIIQGEKGWYFDTDAGIDEIRIRRIGRNELAVMQSVLAYYDAQLEYAEVDRNGNGVLEYAQKLISSPNANDGLFWQTSAEKQPSPLGPLFAEKTPLDAYHGYYYRILKSQGAKAKSGAYSYLVGDQMVAGFALIAWPAEYGNSGVMSFIVSHDGIAYQQDLGLDTNELAMQMQSFDPGPDWVAVQ